MKMRAMLMVAVGFLIAADAREDAVKQEVAKLKGMYATVSVEEEGKALPDEARTAKVEFTADKMIVLLGNMKSPAAFTIDPTAKPKTIDLVGETGPDKGKVLKGIYEFDGETLKLATARNPKDERPTEFATKKGSKSTLIVLKKEKK